MANKSVDVMEKPIETDVRPNTPTTVCFVCTGNTCRSPMAAAALNQLGLGAYSASSAGLCANEGEAISENAVKALESKGIECTPKNNYKSHKARQAETEFLERFDKIVAISRGHMMSLLVNFPQLAEKITVMPEDIPDPFMQGEEVYERCLESIIHCLKELFAL